MPHRLQAVTSLLPALCYCQTAQGTLLRQVYGLGQQSVGTVVFDVWCVFPQTVCPHYGVLTVVVRSGVLRGVLLPLLVSTAQARTEFVCDDSVR